MLSVWEERKVRLYGEHANVHQSHSQNDSGDLRGVAGGDGELGCLCGKAGTSHLCDGSAIHLGAWSMAMAAFCVMEKVSQRSCSHARYSGVALLVTSHGRAPSISTEITACAHTLTACRWSAEQAATSCLFCASFIAETIYQTVVLCSQKYTKTAHSELQLA